MNSDMFMDLPWRNRQPVDNNVFEVTSILSWETSRVTEDIQHKMTTETSPIKMGNTVLFWRSGLEVKKGKVIDLMTDSVDQAGLHKSIRLISLKT